MKRRKAIGLISSGLLGAAIIPSCNWTNSPTFNNFSLSGADYKILERLSNIILPIPDEMKIENTSPTKFALTMLDDCNSPEDISSFMNGFEIFKSKLKSNRKDRNAFLLPDVQAIIKENTDSEPQKKNLNSLVDKMKSYNLQYYKTLSGYLEAYTDFEFIPGRFTGCVNV